MSIFTWFYLYFWHGLVAGAVKEGFDDVAKYHDRFKKALRKQLTASMAPRSTVLICLLVGWVFSSEGIQKFLSPNELGVGRFAKIGIPAPDVIATFVGI